MDAVTVHNGFQELCTCLNADAGKEQGQAYLPEHHVCRGGCVGVKLELPSVCSNQDGDNQRTAGKAQFYRSRHAGNSDWNGSENDTNEDANEDACQVGMIQFLY